jgi:hypothetical protein
MGPGGSAGHANSANAHSGNELLPLLENNATGAVYEIPLSLVNFDPSH